MEKETYKPQDEQAENTNHDTLQDMPSFEEHMNNIESEKNHDKYAEIEANIAEIMSDKMKRVFIVIDRDGFGAENFIGNRDVVFRNKRRGDTIKHRNGEIEDRKMSEQYALWRVAKDIASSFSLDDPKRRQEKAFRDFEVVERLWGGASSDELRQHYDEKLDNLENERKNIAEREEPSGVAIKFRNLLVNSESQKDYLLLQGSLDLVESKMVPYIREYEEYEQSLGKAEGGSN